MKKAHDPNQKHYFILLKAQERHEILIKAASAENDFNLWEIGKEDQLEKFLSHGLLKQEVIGLKTAGSLLKVFKKSLLINRTVLVKFLYQNCVYFGRGLFTDGVHDGGYALEMDSFLYRAQQRRDYRLKASANAIIQIKIGETVYQGIDVSAGGISFQAQEDDPEMINQAYFKQIKIKINQKTFEIPQIQIVKIIARRHEPNTICCQFQNLTEAQDIALSNHVIMEARGEIMMKKILGK